MTFARAIPETDLQAYVDGCLTLERQAAVEHWLAAHPEEASRVTAYRLLGEQWRVAYAGVLHEPLPQKMLAAVRPPRRRLLAAAIAAGVAVVALGVWQVPRWWPELLPWVAAPAMVHRAAIAHAVYAAEIRHPVEAEADNGELLAWLSERLGMRVQAPDLRAAGMGFIGGRLIPGERAPAALLMYEGPNGRRVTLYWGPEFRRERETALRYARAENGTRLYYWIDDACGYAVASADLSRAELLRIATMAYAELEE